MPLTTVAPADNQSFSISIANEATFVPNVISKEAIGFQKMAREKTWRKTHPIQSYFCDTKSACREYVAPFFGSCLGRLEPGDLLQSMTPNSRSAVVVSQVMLSQHSHNSGALSENALSQNPHISLSKHIHPDRLNFETPSQGPSPPARGSETIAQRPELPE